MLQNGDWDNIYLYGNYMHHAGKTNESDPFGYKVQSIYISGFQGQYNNINLAWNEFYSNNGNVQIYGHNSMDSIETIYIHDNLFRENGTTGMVLNGGDGLTTYSFVKNAWVYNNIFMQNLSYAMKITDSSTGSRGGKFYVYNNVFYDNGDAEIYSPNPEALYIYNNIFHTNNMVYFTHSPGTDANHYGLNNCFYGSASIPSWSADSIYSNPGFIAEAPCKYSDFAIQPDSPGVDGGTSSVSSVVATDFMGLTRPQGMACDIGAFEYALQSLPPADITSPAAPLNLRFK